MCRDGEWQAVRRRVEWLGIEIPNGSRKTSWKGALPRATQHLHEAQFPLRKGRYAVHALGALLCDINLYQGLILTRRQQDGAYNGAFKFARGVLIRVIGQAAASLRIRGEICVTSRDCH